MSRPGGPMSEQIRISAKNLGDLAMADFCPRCLWLKLRVNNKLPFQIFPGIFSSIDSYTKSIVHGWFDKHGSAPPWLAELGDIRGYKNPPHYSKFNITDEEHNILLTGGPDAIFVKGDGSYIIADYKTAKYTGSQDNLLPMYSVQLNAYALIGGQCGYSPVTSLALIYMEPRTDKEKAAEDGSCHDSGFNMQFNASIHPLTLDTRIIAPLLGKLREIYEKPSAPEGKAGCKNCEALDNLKVWLG
jgi:hypothetical protein